MTNHYIYGILDENTLKTLHVSNGFGKIEFEHIPDCPNLRQLAISILKEDAIDWLNEQENQVTELIITGSYTHFNEEDGVETNHSDSSDFIALKRPLTFLYVRELYIEEPVDRANEHHTILDFLLGKVFYGLQSLALSVDRSQLVSLRYSF